MSPAQPIGIPSFEIPAFSGEDQGPAHSMFKAFFVAEARKNRVLMHKTCGSISAGYERKARAAAKLAAQHHRLGLIEIANAKVSRSYEAAFPSDERRGVFQAVRK
jgi:hypothetical protein